MKARFITWTNLAMIGAVVICGLTWMHPGITTGALT